MKAIKRRKCQDKEHEGFNSVNRAGRMICLGCNAHIYVPGKGFVYMNNDNKYYFVG